MATLYNTKFYHRDLSWLRFNHRVLQEAADDGNLLYERIKFLAIFSSNLDEFFRVRVSDIRQIKKIEKPLRKKLISKPNSVLKEIKKQVDIQQNEFGKIFNEEIIPQLALEGIHLIRHEDFSEIQKKQATTYFKESLKQIIEISSNPSTKNHAVFVKNERLYLAAQTENDEFILVEIPETEPRFFVFPSEDNKNFHITFIDDILKFNLENQYSENGKTDFFSIKISRDAELYIEDEFSGNLMEKIKAALPKRDTGQATRVLIDPKMPKKFEDILKSVLDVNHTDVVLGGRYHNFKDFFGPREINLFYLKENLRERIIEQDGRFYGNESGLSFSKEEIVNELHENPHRFSPNALLRPLYQEFILPNLCYIGGGGELAYWFQLKDYFNKVEVPFPILLLRNSLLLIPKMLSEKLKKLNVAVDDLFLPQHELMTKHTHEISQITIDFSKQKEFLKQQFLNLYELAKETDASFLSAVAAQEKKQLNGLDNLEKRLLKAQKRNLSNELDRVKNLQNQLFPNQGLQERQLNFSEFYLEYGEELLDALKENLKPLDFNFTFLKL